MMKMATFDQNDLLAIKPEQVRTRITISEPARLSTREVKLALKFEYKGDSEQEYLFFLEPILQKQFVEKRWLKDDLIRHQYEFRIADNSIKEFRSYQREFLKYGKPNKYHWTVYYFLEKRPEKGEALDLDLELKLADKEDYFYLLVGAEVDVE